MALSTPILRTVYGALAKLEASYGAGATVAAGTDGQLLAEECILATDFTDEGDRVASAGTTGQVIGVAPSGKFGKVKLRVEARGIGGGGPYSASVFPPDFAYVGLRMAGHSFTLNTGSYVVAPQSNPAGGFASAYLELYPRGLKLPMTGCVADWSWTIQKNGITFFEFDTQGITGTEAETALPAITYVTPASAPTPRAINIGLAIGAYTPAVPVRSITVKGGRQIVARQDIQGTGHGGFALGDRKPEVVIEMERVALGTFNPYTIRDNATAQALAFGIGTVANDKINFAAPQAKLRKVEDVSFGPTAGWKLTFSPQTSGPAVDDDYTLTFAA